MTTDLTNQRAYQSPVLARSYAQQSELHELRPQRMLDVGGGGGRATEKFAALVEDYVGIDYSEPMVAAYPDPTRFVRVQMP